MTQADGSVIIDTRVNTNGFSKGAANLKTQFNGLGAAAKKLGVIIAAAFSVSAIVAFGKEAIELGSDLQEVQNVVDVTFTTMNEQINEFAQNAALTAGLSETMAKRYAGTFGAMAKSFKFTENEAYDMATALTQLTGDVASFYNITQDEAYTKLKSVFTGETESLKDLGVVMTQTALDDFAMRKGLGKTVQQMTEQEKVALRYQFVLEQLSGASGDFVRTQGSWANQTRILSLQFDQLKATIGQGLINALTPVLKLMNQLIGKLQQFAVAFRNATVSIFGDASGASGGIADTMGAAAENADALTAGITDAGKAAKKSLAGFDEINKLTGGSAENAGNLPSGTNTGGNIPDSISPAVGNVAEKIKSFLEPLNDISFSPLISSLSSLGTKFLELGGSILEALGWSWDNLLVPLSEWTIEDLAPETVNMLAAAFDTYHKAIEPVSKGMRDMFAHIKPIFEWVGSIAIQAIQGMQTHFKRMGEVFEEKGPVIRDIVSNLGEVFGAVWQLLKPILDEITNRWGYVFQFISDVVVSTIDDVIDYLHGFTEFLAGIFTGDMERAFGGINEMWNALWSGLYDALNDPVNSIIRTINMMIAGICDGLNAVSSVLNGFSFDIPDWAVFGNLAGKKFSINLPTITAPQIPYLAKGAVIPPNAPFAAILGDQRHGNNLEAPESTIRGIYREEMADVLGGMMAGFEALVTEVRELRSTVESIEVGDDTIGEAANRHNSKMAVIKGGIT